jgi:hypothetical protein
MTPQDVHELQHLIGRARSRVTAPTLEALYANRNEQAMDGMSYSPSLESIRQTAIPAHNRRYGVGCPDLLLGGEPLSSEASALADFRHLEASVQVRATYGSAKTLYGEPAPTNPNTLPADPVDDRCSTAATRAKSHLPDKPVPQAPESFSARNGAMEHPSSSMSRAARSRAASSQLDEQTLTASKARAQKKRKTAKLGGSAAVRRKSSPCVDEPSAMSASTAAVRGSCSRLQPIGKPSCNLMCRSCM